MFCSSSCRNCPNVSSSIMTCHFQADALSVIVTIIENGIIDPSSIADEAFHFTLLSFGKALIILFSLQLWINIPTEFFSLCKATNIGEEKFSIQTSCTLLNWTELVSIPSPSGGVECVLLEVNCSDKYFIQNIHWSLKTFHNLQRCRIDIQHNDKWRLKGCVLRS